MTTRLGSFTTAILRFSEALSAPETDLTRDAAIQRFEFCFELAWKVIQERARMEGLDCQSPKGCLKLAYKNGWIGHEVGWLAMLEDRNRTAHTYDETLAKDVYRRLPAYLPLRRRVEVVAIGKREDLVVYQTELKRIRSAS